MKVSTGFYLGLPEVKDLSACKPNCVTELSLSSCFILVSNEHIKEGGQKQVSESVPEQRSILKCSWGDDLWIEYLLFIHEVWSLGLQKTDQKD